MIDRFQLVRASLVAARAQLHSTHPKFADRIGKMESRLTPSSQSAPNPDFDGDAVTAWANIRVLMNELAEQKEIRKVVAGPGETMKQSGKPVLPPNVAAAIYLLAAALEHLNVFRRPDR